MKKKIGDLTMREVDAICNSVTNEHCEGCPLKDFNVCAIISENEYLDEEIEIDI